jgi:hypothetical protein
MSDLLITTASLLLLWKLDSPLLLGLFLLYGVGVIVVELLRKPGRTLLLVIGAGLLLGGDDE